MNNIRIVHRKPVFVIGLITFGVAAIGAVLLGGLRFRPVDGHGWQALLPAAVLAVTLILGIVWQSRARAATRLQHALDAYAQREDARERRGTAPALAGPTPRGPIAEGFA